MFPRRYHSPIDSGGGSKDTVTGSEGDQKPGDQQQPDPSKPSTTPEVVTYTPEQQRHIDKLIADARTEGRTAGKTQAEQDAERKRTEESGDKDAKIKLLEGDKGTLQSRIDELEGQLAQRDDETVRLRVAAKYKLPEGWHVRLQGKSEADYDRDAKEMAKQVAPPKPLDREPGQRGDKTPDAQKKASQERARSSSRYSSA